MGEKFILRFLIFMIIYLEWYMILEFIILIHYKNVGDNHKNLSIRSQLLPSKSINIFCFFS